ncbi:monovalent cation/H+ antiporter complex subunit F [Brachybacterium vulturis]|uniref:monovalent cation/H+ antiporter complex subunit F n=1 Tax=Brachybacterium vulturis TaxID=2017484 RepID=UPI0012FD08A1|nr:monovalent cation/H+ antiporter complex subunit F [Brachybacterium vulturis]
MSTFELVLVVFAVVLAAAALGVVYRMIVGPTILDRALASDSLVTLVVMGMALYAAQSGTGWAGPAMLGLTGLAFIGTVTFARFVAREDSRQGIQSRYAAEPVTETAPHEAIHPDPTTGPIPEDGPDVRSAPSPEEDLWGRTDPPEDPERPGEPDPGGFGAEGRHRWPEEPTEGER